MKAKKSPGSRGKDAGVWQSPEFQNLSNGLDKILKLPKEAIEKRLAAERASKAETDTPK